MTNELNLPMGIDAPVSNEETHMSMSTADTAQEEV